MTRVYSERVEEIVAGWQEVERNIKYEKLNKQLEEESLSKIRKAKSDILTKIQYSNTFKEIYNQIKEKDSRVQTAEVFTIIEEVARYFNGWIDKSVTYSHTLVMIKTFKAGLNYKNGVNFGTGNVNDNKISVYTDENLVTVESFMEVAQNKYNQLGLGIDLEQLYKHRIDILYKNELVKFNKIQKDIWEKQYYHIIRYEDVVFSIIFESEYGNYYKHSRINFDDLIINQKCTKIHFERDDSCCAFDSICRSYHYDDKKFTCKRYKLPFIPDKMKEWKWYSK